MPKQDIKISDIDKVGMELFRKYNQKYIKSDLSDVMERIFVAANIESGIIDVQDETYMKSGTIPGRVFYIYSDQVYEKARYKNYDIVVMNDEECIWLYSKNIMANIQKKPGTTIFLLYDALIDLFRNKQLLHHNFANNENIILKYVMSIRLMTFLNEEYNQDGSIIDPNKFKEELSKYIINFTGNYGLEAISAFIDDVIDHYYEHEYFVKRKYLDSYKLIFTTKV